MAQYKISGVWKNSSGVITHYAFHLVSSDSISRCAKTSKADAISILEKQGNSALTWIWNYQRAKWDDGENVEVVNAVPKYLRSNRDNKLTDNLGHLIDFDWIAQ